MTGAQIITVGKAALAAIRWRIKLARRRLAKRDAQTPPPPASGVACIMLATILTLAAGCARFDPFWAWVGDNTPIEKEAGK